MVAARNRNLSTALILLSVAIVFFAGVIAKYWFLSGG
jgi:hypothetical protein